MDLTNKSNLGSKEVAEVLKVLMEKSDSPASFHLGVKVAFNKELIDSDILEEIKEVAHENLISSGDTWPEKWD